MEDSVVSLQSDFEAGKFRLSSPDAEVTSLIMDEVIVRIRKAIDPETVRRFRRQLWDWGQGVPPRSHGVAMQDLDVNENHHRIDDDPAKSAVPHIHHHFDLNRLDTLPAGLKENAYAIFSAILDLQNRLAETAGEFSPTENTLKVRPQAIQYPSGGGFFGEHSHDLDPQRVGLILSLSERGLDFAHGGTVFRTKRGVVDTSENHSAGDILLFRYDVPHAVDVIDASSDLDFTSPKGRWTAVLPYY